MSKIVLPKDITLRNDFILEPIDWSGGDWLTLDAARVSRTGTKGAGRRDTREFPKDVKLMGDLTGLQHGGPFTHGSLTAYVETTIAVLREWRTHKIVMYQDEDEILAVLSSFMDFDGYSEASQRYRPLKGEFWFPGPDRPFKKLEGTSQMRPQYRVATETEYKFARLDYEEMYQAEWNFFRRRLEAGDASEVARCVIGTGIYTAMYVTMNPRSIMKFLQLRTHEPTAHLVSFPLMEIEQSARQLEELFAANWPLAYEKFCENGRIAP